MRGLMVRRRLEVALALSGAALSVAAAFSRLGWLRGALWDLDVYARAVADLAAGGDPYRTDVELPFVYHPYVLHALAGLHALVPLAWSLPALYAIAIAYVGYELRSYVARVAPRLAEASPPAPSLVAAALVFGGSGVVALGTGNLTPALHAVVLGSLLRALRRRRGEGAFFVALGVASFVKPYFLAYVALAPLVCARRVAAARAVGLSAAVGLAWASSAFTLPALHEGFTCALRLQTLGRGDLGYSAFGVASGFGLPPGLALAAHAALFAGAALALARFVRRHAAWGAEPSLLGLGVVLATLANPRMKEYDFFVAVLAAYLLVALHAPRALWSALGPSLALAAVPAAAAAVRVITGLHAPSWLTSDHGFELLGFTWIALVALGVAGRASPGVVAPRTLPGSAP
jgi:hypothetical protein